MAIDESVEKSKQSTSKEKKVIIASLILGLSLVLGLGIGLGVGLNKVEYVYVSFTSESTVGTESHSGISHATTTFPTPENAPWLKYRLPDHLEPSYYRITIQPNMTLGTYHGTTEITLKAVMATRYVVLHAHKDLTIGSVKLQRVGDDTDVTVIRTFRYHPFQFYVITCESDLEQEMEYILSMDFNGSLVSSLAGIYMSSYNDPISGERKGIVAASMKTTNARRGYPCFDEPAMKARYIMTIVHEQRHTALSNMPVNTTEDIGNGLNRTIFKHSVPMSTYHVTFVVGELGYIEDFSERGIPLRIYGAKYLIDKGLGDYALNMTKAIFGKYEVQFGMNYSLPKYDQVVLPEHIAMAAANWGLCTYTEAVLLWDPLESTTYARQVILRMMSHEMSHQWFGNLVTMKWWDNYWLNEGVSVYFQYDGIAWAEPTWKTANIFNAGFDVHYSLKADQSIASRPLKAEVNSQSQIATMYNIITFYKGAATVRYLNYVIGEELFFGAITTYLKNMEFRNANELDLWRYVQEYVTLQGADFNIEEIMNVWVQQQGYPVVHVNVTGTRVTVTQEQMLIDPDADKSSLPVSKYGYKWTIKMQYVTSLNTTSFVWFNASEDSVSFQIAEKDDWVLLQNGLKGYYRANYDSDTWNNIARQLQIDHTVISKVDRAQLIDDIFNLAAANHMTYEDAFNMTRFLKNDGSLSTWLGFSYSSTFVTNMLASTPHYKNYKKYFLSRVKRIADEVGWNGTEGSHERKRLRQLTLRFSLQYGDEEAARNASDLFRRWRDENIYIHPDVRPMVYEYGVANGDERAWETVLNRYVNESATAEKDSLLRGLAATRNVELIHRLLNYANDKTIIIEQDFAKCIAYISSTEIGNRMAWSWVRSNWEDLVHRFGLESIDLGRIVPSIISNYNTDIQRWEVEEFIRKHPDGGAGTLGRKNAQVQIDFNIAWLKRNQGAIGRWLAETVAEL